MPRVARRLGCFIAASVSFQAAHAGQISEVMAGLNGDSAIQFVELRAAADNTLWPEPGAATGRVMLEFFDGADRLTGRFVLVGRTAGTASTVLIATPKVAQLPDVPAPDFIMPPNVNANNGKVCLRGNPDSTPPVVISECVAYGSADAAGATAALPIMGAQTLALRDVAYVLGAPTPANSAAPDNADVFNNAAGSGGFEFSPADTVAQGKNLFTLETFGGNGRTCSTCHVAPFFNLTPEHVQQRSDDDPLFVGDAARNINTLVITHSGSATGFAQPSDLRGEIHDANGHRARVVAGTGNRYLIDGGQTLSGTVSDSFGNSAFVSEVIAGNLTGPNPVNGDALGIEDPTGERLRVSAASAFPQGRALIVENIDGFDQPAVFRKSPHLLNIKDTAPFGLSGEFDNLADFSAQAVRQHYTLDLRRREGTDFRLPTSDELAAMVAFQESIRDVPPPISDAWLDNFLATPGRVPGGRPDSLAGTLNSVRRIGGNITTPLQLNGLIEFNGLSCDACHRDALLGFAAGTVPPAAGTTATGARLFDTGVTTLPINGTDGLRLDRAPGMASRPMSVPPLVGVRHTAPYFHDHSAATLEEAVAFYNTPELKAAAAANFPGVAPLLESPIFQIDAARQASLVAFLRTLTQYPFDFTRLVVFDGTGVGESATATFTLSNQGARPLRVASAALTRFFATGQPPSDASPFSWAEDLAEAVVEPGATREFPVFYRPTAAAQHDAVIELHLADGTETWDVGIALAGTGLAAGGASHETVFADPQTGRPMPTAVDMVIEATGRKTPVAIPFGIPQDIDGIASVTNDAPANGRYRVGLTVVTQVATDQLGNRATQTFNVLVRDTTAPSIKWPKPVHVTTDADQVHIDLTPPRVFDAVGVKWIRSNAPAVFTPGTHRITWTARDYAGNVSRVRQRIVVTAVPDVSGAGGESQRVQR